MKRNLTTRLLCLLLSLSLILSLCCVTAFAATELSLSLDNDTVAAGSTVTMTVGTTDTLSISSFGFKATASDSSITVQSFENGDVTLSASNKRTQKAAYLAGAESDITTWAKVVFSIPSDLAPGTYTLGVEQVTASDTQNVNPINGITSKQATLTVTGAPAAEGYTVAVSAVNAKINTGDTAMVKLAISNLNVAYYNAVDMKLTYDANVLNFDKTKSTGLPTDATVTDANGSLRIQFYGENRTDALQLAFTGIAAGESEVKVTEAKIDKSENALKNAPAATVTGSATITVGQTYTVNRDTNVVDGNPKAEAGKDYTFKLVNGLDGTYMDVKYKVGDGEFKDLMLVDGKYTIPAGEITGDITGDITITAVGKTYTVTKAGAGANDVTLNGNTATYGTNYTFTLNKTDNYAYTVTVTAGGKTVTSALDADGKTYTINGKDITGDVGITVTKEANKAQINFKGSGSADVVNGTSQTAGPGKDFTFTITKEDGYAYTVTAATADDTAVAVKDNGDGAYTIAGADIAAGDVITVTVEKKLIETKYTVEVTQYVKLDGKAVFLITAKLADSAKLSDGKVLAYGNNAMFQNAERYDGAYAYLVISDKTLDEVKAEAEKAGQITEVDSTAQTFNVDGDVNGTGLVDINDAQLVYNIYKAKYDNFDATTMAMFLAADMNDSRTVTVEDAAAVVAKIQ
jgi:hypothetical protein